MFQLFQTLNSIAILTLAIVGASNTIGAIVTRRRSRRVRAALDRALTRIMAEGVDAPVGSTATIVMPSEGGTVADFERVAAKVAADGAEFERVVTDGQPS